MKFSGIPRRGHVMSSNTSLDQYNSCYSSQPRRFSTPPPKWKTSRCSPVMPGSERKPRRSPRAKTDLFHVIHKIPAGDSPYVRAKHVQLIEKDPSRAISMFWAAINSGDRVDSALKDMAVVMKQLDRSDEAIEAIKSFRHLCTPESQESLDNILVELYKQSGRIEEEIEVLQLKLKQLEEGIAFGGKKTKMARSQGKKVQITVEKDYSRLLGNLAWAYMQQKDFKSAEEHYRKALSIGADKNKQCNLAMCLMHMNKLTEAKVLLQAIRVSSDDGPTDESHAKSYERASQMLVELETQNVHKPMKQTEHENEFGIARGIVDGNLNKMVHSEACGSGLCFQKYYKYSNGSESSPLSSSFNNMNMGPSTEFPYEKRADFDWRRNHYQFNMVQEGGCEDTRVFDSPFCNGRIPKVPFTQPRRCSLCSNNGDQRKEGGSAEKAHGGCCRKLSFEQSIEGETVQSVKNQNHLNHFSTTSANVMPKVLPQISEEHFPSTGGGDWRKISLDDLGRVNSETVRTSKNNEERVTNLLVDDSQKKPALDKHGLPSATAISSDRQNDKEISGGDSNHNYNFISACGMTASDDAIEMENHKSMEEHHTGWRKTCEIKKSWADMVEEDEKEFKNWRIDCPNNCSSNTFQEFLLSYHTPGKYKEGFSDENLDSNVITETLSPLNYTKQLSEKMESTELGCGYFTQAENPSVSRSLSNFVTNQKPGMGNHCADSPLPSKALNFEGKGLMASEDFCPAKSIKRRNRLQVFQDITHVPGSPGP